MRRLRPVGERIPLPPLFSRDVRDARGDIERECFAGWRAAWYGSGTCALAAAVSVAIRQAHGKSHPEVIIPAYACPDVVSAVRFAGAMPVVADQLPNLPWLDPRGVANAVSSNTVAVLYVRFLGLPANDRALKRVCDQAGTLLIEDAAHTFPLESGVRSSANLSVLSFGRGKPVSLRHGGVLLQRPDAVAATPPAAFVDDRDRKAFRHWLSCASYNVGAYPVSYWLSSRMRRVDAIGYRDVQALSAFRSELGACLERAIQVYRRAGLAKQRTVGEIVRSVGAPLIDVARHAAQSATTECSSSHESEQRLWRYPLLLPSRSLRDRLFGDLWGRGLGASRMYQSLLTEMPTVAPHVRSSSTPNARDFARRLLTLPLHGDLTERDYERIQQRLQLIAGAEPEPLDAAYESAK